MTTIHTYKHFSQSLTCASKKLDDRATNKVKFLHVYTHTYNLTTCLLGIPSLDKLLSSYQAKSNSPWNLSFSWSQALQLPLLELCKKNPPGSDLPLAEMTALLEKELVIAGEAARGEYDYASGQGDHN